MEQNYVSNDAGKGVTCLIMAGGRVEGLVLVLRRLCLRLGVR